MNDKLNELQFDIGNEVSRIKNADPFELYVLKCQINKSLEANKIAENIKENLHPGYKYVYFDTELNSEDAIMHPVVYADDKLILGVRCSDQKKISTSIFSIDLSRSSSDFDENLIEESKEIEDPWKLKYRERIAVTRYINLNNQRYVKCGYSCEREHLFLPIVNSDSCLMVNTNSCLNVNTFQ